MTAPSTRRRPRATTGSTRRSAGFTLIELMIAVAVVAILAAIAYPSYTRYVQEARRTDAMSVLSSIAGQLERCYTVTSDYTTKNGTDPCVPSSITSDEGFYQVSVSASAASYTLTATPAEGSPQASDTECPSFTLDQQGNKGPDATRDKCWK